MAEVTQSQVEEKLASYVDPYLEKDLVSSKCIKDISIDGDTSTNDTVLLLANGAAGGEPLGARSDDLDRFLAALMEVCVELAKAVAFIARQDPGRRLRVRRSKRKGRRGKR